MTPVEANDEGGFTVLTATDPGDENTAPAAEVTPKPETHIYVDIGATGDYALRDAPPGLAFSRRLTIDGQNVEHVDDCPTTGVWRYRRM